MALLNPRFLLPGDHPGEAAHWTLTAFTSLERFAGFGPEPYQACEGFDRWTELLRDLDAVVIAFALFDALPEAVEDFEDAWQNDAYLFELPTGHIIRAAFDGKAEEDLETGWQNDLFAWLWEDVPSVTAVFDGDPREDFETMSRSCPAPFRWRCGSKCEGPECISSCRGFESTGFPLLKVRNE
jgi:hypothetical protein